MSYPKIATLIKTLYEKTKEGWVNWEETPEDGAFQASFPNYSIQTFCNYSEENDCYDYGIRIYNNEGKMVECVTDPQVSNCLADAFSVMKETYEMARRRAMGVEQAIDSLLKELEDTPF